MTPLRQQMIAAMRQRGFADRTHQSYLAAVSRLARYYGRSPAELSVDELQACRTEALGGRQLRCDRCDTEQRWYYGCRDRHCPQCQGRATRQWAERQQQHLLPVRYYHLVLRYRTV
jgi:hypothetical protein